MSDTTRDIIRSLDRLSTHRRKNDVFDDWLEVSYAMLRMLPVHARSLADTGSVAEDDAATAALWTRLREGAGYGPDDFLHFARAYAALVEGSDDAGVPDYKDVLGDLYMSWAHPNAHSGQFFTPWAICQITARMIIGDPYAMLAERVTSAIDADLSAFGMDPTQPRTLEWIAKHLLPSWADRFVPISINDPAIGSGGMLLAAAEVFPSWAVRMGLVQFSGNDIDHTCVRMSMINMMLYGLNGYGLELSTAAHGLLVRYAPSPEPDFTMREDGQGELFSNARRVA